MRIGLNLLYLLPGIVGGTETYAMGLLKGLAEHDSPDDVFVFVSQEARDWPIPGGKNVTRVVCNVHASQRGVRYAYEQIVLPRLVKKYRVDVLHSLGYTGPLNVSCKSVITIHDMNFIAFGHQMPLLRRAMLNLFVRTGAGLADHIITVSAFSRDEIRRCLGTPEEKITVIHEAPHPARQDVNGLYKGDLLKSFHLAKPYWVAFSSESPNKNIPNLLRAVSEIHHRYGLKHQLVLIGHKPVTREMNEALSHGSGSVVFTGYLNDKDVVSVLSGAQMLIVPSLYEGFGLPVLEAMALGVPVTCSAIASLPEVAGNGALFFDPTNTHDMAEKIASLATSSEQQALLRERGYENVKRFSWKATARKTLKLYQEICA